jgi:DNA polymerase (family 10)
MENLEVARLFDRMAAILEIKGKNPFRIRDYRGAAQNLESLTEDLEALAWTDRLDEIPGVARTWRGGLPGT